MISWRFQVESPRANVHMESLSVTDQKRAACRRCNSVETEFMFYLFIKMFSDKTNVLFSVWCLHNSFRTSLSFLHFRFLFFKWFCNSQCASFLRYGPMNRVALGCHNWFDIESGALSQPLVMSHPPLHSWIVPIQTFHKVPYSNIRTVVDSRSLKREQQRSFTKFYRSGPTQGPTLQPCSSLSRRTTNNFASSLSNASASHLQWTYIEPRLL